MNFALWRRITSFHLTKNQNVSLYIRFSFLLTQMDDPARSVLQWPVIWQQAVSWLFDCPWDLLPVGIFQPEGAIKSCNFPGGLAPQKRPPQLLPIAFSL